MVRTLRNTTGKVRSASVPAGESWTWILQVRLAGMTAVPDRGERLAAPYDVAHLNRDAALLEVGQDHVATIADVDHQAPARSPFVPGGVSG